MITIPAGTGKALRKGHALSERFNRWANTGTHAGSNAIKG